MYVLEVIDGAVWTWTRERPLSDAGWRDGELEILIGPVT